jgi:hypothetical protein
VIASGGCDDGFCDFQSRADLAIALKRASIRRSKNGWQGTASAGD